MTTALLTRSCSICEQLVVSIVDKDKWLTTKMSGRGEKSVMEVFAELTKNDRDQLTSGCHVPCLDKWFGKKWGRNG